MSENRITVFPEEIIGRISPYLAGACLEDVNHEVYGGIYSQMIFGESFEEEPMKISPEIDPAFHGLEGTISCLAEREYLKDESEIRSWQPFRQGTARGYFKATQRQARRGCRSQLIEFLDGDGEVGIENRGLNRWGMNFAGGKAYEGLVVAKAEKPGDTHLETGASADDAAGVDSADKTSPDGVVEVWTALENGSGSKAHAQQRLLVPADGEWHAVRFTLIPDGDQDTGRFAIKLREKGRIWIDYVLLQPGNWGRFKGTAARKDIADALVEQKLTVLRYGGYMINTDWEHELQCPGSGYRWKKMIGPRQDRPPYRGTFYRYNSNGFGILDFLELCSAAGFMCIPTLNPMESIENLRDFIEYANGDADTTWGGRRAANGHPEPFRLRYIQIGNEEHSPIDGLPKLSYIARIRSIVEAMHDADPGVVPILGANVITTGNPVFKSPAMVERIRAAVQAVRGFHVLWDIHIGGDGLFDAQIAEDGLQFFRNTIDEIDPENQVGLCVLEENGQRHDMQRALGHAHNIIALERLGFVEIDCAANCLQPWLQNDNSWDQGQTFFTPSKVWGMPPYYAQQMLSRFYRPLRVRASIQNDSNVLSFIATRSENGDSIFLKIVNLGSEPQITSIVVDSGDSSKGAKDNAWRETARVIMLTGNLDDRNTPEKPRRIVPSEQEYAVNQGTLEIDLPAYSFTAIGFEMDN